MISTSSLLYQTAPSPWTSPCGCSQCSGLQLPSLPPSALWILMIWPNRQSLIPSSFPGAQLSFLVKPRCELTTAELWVKQPLTQLAAWDRIGVKKQQDKRKQWYCILRTEGTDWQRSSKIASNSAHEPCISWSTASILFLKTELWKLTNILRAVLQSVFLVSQVYFESI